MRLASVRDLKRQLLLDIVAPLLALAGGRHAQAVSRAETRFAVGAQPLGAVPHVQRSVALGIARQSLIIDADMRAVGLLFAGGETGGSNGLGLTYANPLRRVLADMKATLLT